MVTLALPRLFASGGSAGRALSMVERNVSALRGAYWIVVATGLFEPVFYLLSIGVGVGALVGDIPLPGGRSVAYAVFVAPALLASSAMTGALSETTFNFFGKMKFMRLYDGILATPLRPMEIAFGELSWAMVRGSVYAAAFCVIMVAMDLTSAGRAVIAFLAAVLVGFAFGGVGLAMTTFMRSWQDFDLMSSAQFALFLFSGTFVPAESYPVVLRWLVEVTPLYRSVHLIRGISIGTWSWVQLLDVFYLLILFVGGVTVAGRRMGRLLLK
ncbi:ABC transporter permease [Actinoplanes sp. NBRC 103695]|uniref:ABC transporter permease n=1 Tax=Actinoplanes sp. NBRC 103695 TaxID=3032202 RepID=UPI0024A2E65C|nr:ABC transporter permease [Actinoplanes sp. NBRC 103695]GLZ01316.1 transport permease protein [Actinoplanes sp. NBRC 103695]